MTSAIDYRQAARRHWPGAQVTGEPRARFALVAEDGSRVDLYISWLDAWRARQERGGVIVEGKRQDG